MHFAKLRVALPLIVCGPATPPSIDGGKYVILDAKLVSHAE